MEKECVSLYIGWNIDTKLIIEKIRSENLYIDNAVNQHKIWLLDSSRYENTDLN